MTLRELANLCNGRVDTEDEQIAVSSVASLDEATEGDVSFYGSPKYLKSLRKCRASAVLVPNGFGEDIAARRVWVEDPAEAFKKVLAHFAPPPVHYPEGIHPSATIGSDVRLGEGVHVGAGAVVEDGVEIGDRTVIGSGCIVSAGSRLGSDCLLLPRVTVLHRSLIGDQVILHSGVVIGADGFGYEFRDGSQQKIPQTGIVQIDDHVEIGANTTVDRARFGRTWIKKGTKIDNQCQIGHNVTIGEHCILCAQVGISGSTRIGNYVTLAGKVGVNGHIEIGDQVIVTAMAGITKSVPAKEVLVGLPARPMREYKANYVLLRNIRKLYERVEGLEKSN